MLAVLRFYSSHSGIGRRAHPWDPSALTGGFGGQDLMASTEPLPGRSHQSRAEMVGGELHRLWCKKLIPEGMRCQREAEGTFPLVIDNDISYYWQLRRGSY